MKSPAAAPRLLADPLARDRLARLRDAAAPRDVFRAALADLGLLLAIEALRDAPTVAGAVRTPHGVCEGERVDEERLLLVAILRAGTGLLAGAQRLVPATPVGLVGLRRERHGEAVSQYLVRLPRDAGGTALVLDPMLATGRSAVRAVDVLNEHGIPDARIRLLVVVAAPEGLERFSSAHPAVQVFAVAVDRGLGPRNEILPGIGDAGDRLYGTEP